MSAIQTAIDLVGGATALATALGLDKPQIINNWRSRRVPAEYCPAIERATNRQVRCEDLRPDVDWAYLREAVAPLMSPSVLEEDAST